MARLLDTVGRVPPVIAFAGFVGAWLLFAGPVYQAAIELREEAFSREEYERVSAGIGPQQQVSAWWWLLPPVYYAKHRRSDTEYRQAVFGAMSVDQRAKAVGFLNKANAWILVSAGAFFIAVKETWELTDLAEDHDWRVPVFVGLIVVMTLACLANTVRSLHRSAAIIEGDHPD